MKRKVIYGPPGTGKTQALVEEIEQSRVEDMAVLSFSRAASQTLIARNHRPRAYIGTIHAMCFNYLGLTRGQVATADRFARWYDSGLTATEDIEWALNIHATAKRMKVDMVEVYMAQTRAPFPIYLVEDIANSWDRWKASSGMYDFEDMLQMALMEKVLPKFDAVVLDEAQDLSDLQWDVVESLLHPKSTFIYAGDDDQAIYTWAGANPQGMREHERGAQKRVLSVSHRVPRAHHPLAEATIRQIGNRVVKDWKPRPHPGRIEFETDIRYTLSSIRDFTVLCRDRWQLSEVEDALIDMGIPYQILGARNRGLFQSPWANAARAIQDEDFKRMNQYSKYMRDSIQEDMNEGKFPKPEDWRSSISWPTDPDSYRYLTSVELLQDPWVTVSTIHSFKGREAKDIVLMAPCSDQVLIGEIEAEIRVWYVALTRSLDRLTIIGDNPFIRRYF